MRKNLLIGASALAMLAVASTGANAADFTDAQTLAAEGGNFADGTAFTVNVLVDTETTLTGGVTNTTTNEGTLAIAGTLNQGAQAIGTTTAGLTSITIASTGALNVDGVVKATNLTNAGTITATAGSITGAVANTGTLNLEGAAAIAGAISGAGVVNLKGTGTASGTIAATTVNVTDTAELTFADAVTAAVVNAGKILGTAAITGDVTNTGTMTTGGIVTGAVSNTGTLTVGANVIGAISGTGAVNFTATAAGVTALEAGKVTVADAKVLTVAGIVKVTGIEGENGSVVLTNLGDASEAAKTSSIGYIGLADVTGASPVENSLTAVTLTAGVLNLTSTNGIINSDTLTNNGTIKLGNGDITAATTVAGTGIFDLMGTGEIVGNVAAAATINVHSTGYVTGTATESTVNVKETGTITIAGAAAHVENLTTEAKATLKSAVDATAISNTLIVDTAATVAAGTVVDLTLTKVTSATDVEVTLVNNAGAGTLVSQLTADNVIFSNGLVDVKQLASSGVAMTSAAVNDLMVSVKGTGTMATVAAGSTGAGAGTALEADKVALATTYDKVYQSADAKKALAELAPEVNGAGVEGALAAVGQVSGTVSNRMEAARGYASLGSTGVASGDEMLKGYGVWGQFFGAYAEQDLRDGIDGYEATTLGFALGADKQFSDNLTAGVSLAYANADIDSTDASAGNNTEIDSYNVSLYGTYNNGSPWYVEGQVGFGFNEYDSTRKINFAGLTAKGDFDGYQYGAKVAAGYTYDMGATLVTPMASLQYTRIELDGYTETGAGGANLKVAEQDYDVLTSELGAKLAVKPFEAAGWTIAPEVHAAWSFDIVKDEAEVTSSFTGGTTSFTTKGKEADEHGLKLGFGVDVANGEDVTVSVNYDAELKEEYIGHVGALKVRYDF